MCGCSKDFIHGLAMPRSEVTGIEDIRRREEIWQFAWDTSKKIIEAHHGKIWFQSKENIGTTFYIRLPIAFF